MNLRVYCNGHRLLRRRCGQLGGRGGTGDCGTLAAAGFLEAAQLGADAEHGADQQSAGTFQTEDAILFMHPRDGRAYKHVLRMLRDGRNHLVMRRNFVEVFVDGEAMDDDGDGAELRERGFGVSQLVNERLFEAANGPVLGDVILMDALTPGRVEGDGIDAGVGKLPADLFGQADELGVAGRLNGGIKSHGSDATRLAATYAPLIRGWGQAIDIAGEMSRKIVVNGAGGLKRRRCRLKACSTRKESW